MASNIENNEKTEDSAKLRILNAAREVFSEKGYDGASIADIVKKAKVNKALPYYYFESKRKILEELVSVDLQYIKAQRKMTIGDSSQPPKISFEEFYDRMLEVLTGKRGVIRIIMSEVMRGTPESSSFFEMLNPLYDEVKPKLERMGIELKDPLKLMMDSFFFHTIPMFMFVAMGDKWAEHYKVDHTELQKKFLESIKRIYIDYSERLVSGK